MAYNRLIVLEGIDGSGKTTIALALTRRLQEMGEPAERFSFPGRDDHALGRWVYSAHHESESPLVPAALQALHIAAHIQSISTLIQPSLEQGHWVILDRFWWSTMAYGRAAGIQQEVLDCLVEAEKLIWGTVRPRLVVLLGRGHGEVASGLSLQYEAIAQSEEGISKVRRISNDAHVNDCVDQIIGILGMRSNA